ncbi:unnamed protein product [Arctia plantaginis]|uniref:Uncharacterized protein n=1 Tax=Arctia plantaginis TaxID=874455 RepID=A0A8S0YLA6_ARCPL|nr:unnamed protein product [Arctia plantaginis]
MDDWIERPTALSVPRFAASHARRSPGYTLLNNLFVEKVNRVCCCTGVRSVIAARRGSVAVDLVRSADWARGGVRSGGAPRPDTGTHTRAPHS